jgi:hypothetical protein
MTKAQRSAAAKKAAATRKANAAAAPAGTTEQAPPPRAADAPKGPHRPVMPDGARPHDPITYAAAIQLGLIAALPE